MPANEFEKNVRNVMGEWKLPPSEDVWPKIEERIRQRRKRRILYFIIFSFFGLSLAGYGVYHFPGRATASIEGNQRTKANQSITVHSKHENAVNPKQTQIPTPKITGQPRTSIPKKRMEEPQLAHIDNDFISTHARNRKRKSTLKTMDEPRTENKIPVDISGNQTRLDPDTTARAIIIQPDPNKTEINFLPGTISYIKKGNSIVSETPGSKTQRKDLNLNKIKWGISFSTGSSIITENPFSFKGLILQDYFSGSLGNYPSNTANGYSRIPASDNYPSFAFKLGLNVKKDISRRSSFTVGLGYTYFADRIKIGPRKDSIFRVNDFSLSSYYRGFSGQTYTDKFHFVELPITYEWRISRNTRNFLSYLQSVSGSYLISSNALTYDTAYGGIYFHNASLVNRFHISLTSEIAYHFVPWKNVEWSIGPQFSFDLNKAFKADFENRKYFLFTGINSRIFFGGKNKK